MTQGHNYCQYFGSRWHLYISPSLSLSLSLFHLLSMLSMSYLEELLSLLLLTRKAVSSLLFCGGLISIQLVFQSNKIIAVHWPQVKNICLPIKPKYFHIYIYIYIYLRVIMQCMPLFSCVDFAGYILHVRKKRQRCFVHYAP